jgi:hypothetical protein
MIEIQDLVLKVPNISPEEGQQMGTDIAQRVAAALPEGTSDRTIGELNLRLSFAPNMSREAMTTAIANRIIDQLTLAYS